jgi:hypothetical protein
MTTVKTYLEHMKTIEENLIALKSSIQTNASSQQKYVSSSAPEIHDLKNQEDTYDRKFNDANAELIALGGKTRQQTLQEFVLVFFYVSFVVITIACTAFVYTQQQSLEEAAKVFGLFLLIGFVSLGLIAKYS